MTTNTIDTPAAPAAAAPAAPVAAASAAPANTTGAVINFTVNGKPVSTQVDAVTPLLWVIRDEIGLKGTKFGCGIGMCGACTVHVDGRAIRSCITPVNAIAGSAITTIEGLDPQGQGAHPLQQAWIATQAPQCGYCQSGQIMQAATLLKDYPQPTDANIDAVMSGNLCRCMAYVRIRKAIKLAAATMKEA
jgi:isoquinoline 1-oxidoreductase alpha subunit